MWTKKCNSLKKKMNRNTVNYFEMNGFLCSKSPVIYYPVGWQQGWITTQRYLKIFSYDQKFIMVAYARNYPTESFIILDNSA